MGRVCMSMPQFVIVVKTFISTYVFVTIILNLFPQNRKDHLSLLFLELHCTNCLDGDDDLQTNRQHTSDFVALWSAQTYMSVR